MSTRSNIAIQKPNGTILSIYVHSDGYPDGVGQCLIDNYKTYISAEKLFRYGDASYLGSTLKECSFYHRDWHRDLDKAHVHKNFESFKKFYSGDIFIEFVYLFKDGQWNVSTQKHFKTKDGYDHGSFCYYTKFEPVITNKEYIKYKDKHEKHAEVKMISKIGEMLKGAGFDGDNISIQGGSAKKTN